MAQEQPTKPAHNFIDLTGQVFGRLAVIGRAPNHSHRACWLCRCECGTEKVILGEDLRGSRTKSCGCLSREKLIERSTKHGSARKGSVSTTYYVWQAMLQRCTNPQNEGYRYYGARGITVCDRWCHSFLNFLEDMGAKPPSLTLERRDNNGPYSPENCHWTTRKDQGNNKRNNVHLTFQGETLTISQFAEKIGMDSHTLGRRLSRGWSVDQALTEPVKRPC